MDQTAPLRLPNHLESAAQRVRLAARAAAQQTVDTLGLAAMATSQVQKRDALLGAQYELSRKLAVFARSFDEALDTEVAREAGLLTATARPDLTPEGLVASWESLTLVDDREVELHISADRFAMAIALACEWELREFDAYMATLMGLPAADHARNPLRAEVVAQAMMRAVDAVSGRPEIRTVLANEIGRTLAQTMRQTYADTVNALRGSGVRPVGLALRASPAPLHSQPGGLQRADGGHPCGGATAEPASGRSSLSGGPSSHSGLGWRGRTANQGTDPTDVHDLPDSRSGHGQRGQTGPGRHGRDSRTGTDTGPGSGQGSALGWVDPNMMGLIRQLADASAAWAAASVAGGLMGGQTGAQTGTAAGTPSGHGWAGQDGQRLVAPNLIHAHREALRQQAGNNGLDHLVIDLVAGLFDQILSDAKVPAQFARQIARLQMPVLRAALGDPTFFSSRRHPVRRFVNRIASLGAAVDDLSAAPALALVQRVAELVQAVLDGDFEQAAVYETQLQALENFVAGQAQAELEALGDAHTVLSRKEDELQLQQAFGEQLDQALQALPVPDYLRHFLTQVWARAIARTEHKEGPASPLAQRMRQTGCALVMSVQPKGAPAQRQLFLRQLPQLMKDLTLGLDHVRCPPEVRRAFHAQLLPAHALALKQPPLSTLEHNLLSRQVAEALATPVPLPGSLPRPSTGSRPAVQALAADAGFTPAEAQAVGLLAEQAVDWDRAVDIDLGQEPELQAVDIDIDGLPPPEAPEPTRGTSLAEHLQLGMAYQMNLDGAWHKVRLAHVSAGRGFYVFTHGHRHRRTVSLTHRMLSRLCETQRLRCVENAYLLERATARARRQLAALKATPVH